MKIVKRDMSTVKELVVLKRKTGITEEQRRRQILKVVRRGRPQTHS